jgi:hypothetical protein
VPFLKGPGGKTNPKNRVVLAQSTLKRLDPVKRRYIKFVIRLNAADYLRL